MVGGGNTGMVIIICVNYAFPPSTVIHMTTILQALEASRAREYVGYK